MNGDGKGQQIQRDRERMNEQNDKTNRNCALIFDHFKLI